MPIKIIIEFVGGNVVSVWANAPVNFKVDGQGFTVAGEVIVYEWHSDDPEAPQYDPVAEGLTQYYPTT